MTHTAYVIADEASESSETAVRTAAETTLVYEDAPPGSLSVVLADADSLRQLNERFRGIDSATDVLAFPDGTVEDQTQGIYFGDVVIAVSVAEEQAESAGHALDSELALLTVHGVLHLLGYDHDSQAEKQDMWARQAAILRQLSVKVKLPA
jgi:probable rRNA maturation factor